MDKNVSINQKFGINIYTLLYIKQMSNKDRLYRTGNYIHYLITTYLLLLLLFFWLHWVLIAVLAFSSCIPWGLLQLHAGFALRCFSCHRAQGLGAWASAVTACGLNSSVQGLCCSTACVIFPDQGLNPCRLHGQADSSPLGHQGRPCKNL